MRELSTLRRGITLILFAFGTSVAGGIAALSSAAPSSPSFGENIAIPDTPYAPYAFLIGDWDSVVTNNTFVSGIHQRLRWGPQNTYITYSAFTRAPGGTEERLHAEGVMTYNAQHRSLDFLFAHEPGTFGEESGTVRVEPDGRIIRESTEVEKDGSLSHSRQIIRQTGPDRAETSLMEQKPDGTWAPAFPGSDQLVMVRRLS
jgi:hypothetical protein